MNTEAGDRHRSIPVAPLPNPTPCMSLRAQLYLYGVLIFLTAGLTGVSLYALIEDVNWFSQEIIMGVVIGACVLFALSIVAYMWTHHRQAVRIEKYRRLRLNKETRHVFGTTPVAGIDDGADPANPSLNSHQSDSVSTYFVNMFNCCLGRPPAVAPTSEPPAPALVVSDDVPVAIPSTATRSEAALMVQVAKANTELTRAIERNDDNLIGQILGQLGDVAISAELLRVTGIGRSVNQIQGLHRPQAQALIALWRGTVAPAVSKPDTSLNTSRASSASNISQPGLQLVALISRIKKNIEQAARAQDIEAVRALLTALVPYTMTEDILRQTGIGVVLSKLSGPVRNQARSLLVQWKIDVGQKGGPPSTPSSANTSLSKMTSTPSTARQTTSTPIRLPAPEQTTPQITTPALSPPPPPESDPITPDQPAETMSAESHVEDAHQQADPTPPQPILTTPSSPAGAPTIQIEAASPLQSSLTNEIQSAAQLDEPQSSTEVDSEL